MIPWWIFLLMTSLAILGRSRRRRVTSAASCICQSSCQTDDSQHVDTQDDSDGILLRLATTEGHGLVVLVPFKVKTAESLERMDDDFFVALMQYLEVLHARFKV